MVVVVGGNSGAQIFAELAEVARATWATREPPAFLHDEVDGRYVFEQATARYRAVQEGRTPDPPQTLGDVVMVVPVRAARDRDALRAERMFVRFTPTGVVWPDGREEHVDVVILAAREPHLWLLGYGEWTGFASATLIAVGRTARAAVEEIVATLDAMRS